MMKSKLRALLWKIFWKLFPPETMSDKLRAMSDRELVILLREIATGGEPWAGFAKKFCATCQKTDTAVINGHSVDFYPCDDLDGGCIYGDDVSWWLKQEVDNEEL